MDFLEVPRLVVSHLDPVSSPLPPFTSHSPQGRRGRALLSSLVVQTWRALLSCLLVPKSLAAVWMLRLLLLEVAVGVVFAAVVCVVVGWVG